MARAVDLIGLGVPWTHAYRLANDPVSVVAAGATVASCSSLPGNAGIFFVVSGTSGVKLPQVGGDSGCLLGDDITIANLSTAAIVIFATTNNAGSAVAIHANVTSATGSTGMSLLSGATGIFKAATASTWVGIKTSV